MDLRETLNKNKVKRANKKEQQELKREEKLKKQKEKEENRNLIAEDKKVFKETKDNLSIISLSEYGYFKTKTGYLDVLQIESIDIKSMNEVEYHTYILSFTNLLQSYIEDMKIIAMNYPADTTRQQKYLSKKIAQCNNANQMKFLEHRMKQLKTIEEKRTNREFFLMIFAKDEKEMLNNKEVALSSNRELQVFEIDIEKKIKILKKLNNMNSKVD
ncbi:hypothetical protein NSA50_18075 [Clostridium sp. DSM 100503]|uniref:hypothetical protein n=1 Tax=Clostridium sp. DSM 100503 TaxID=2963282 RepID=UPI00214A3A86|nr:hypothetical protein [Clostridium sp. DSM 100503]MCR1952913.1 hypothetical protein [Clostridium sp. DSM 100503]